MQLQRSSVFISKVLSAGNPWWTFRLLVLFALCVAGIGAQDRDAAPPLDKGKIEAYVRHLFLWPPNIDVHLSDPEPTKIPGFSLLRVRASQGSRTQQESFYLSSDGQTLLRGDVFDLKGNPFAATADKLEAALSRAPSYGARHAAVSVVVFSDFECPYCRREAQILRKNLISAYPDGVTVYYADFPLEEIHPWARLAAVAGQTIFRENPSVFWDYHDWIFEHQNEIKTANVKEKIRQFVEGKGLGADEVDRVVDANASDSEVQLGIQLGRSLGVNQTPTLFINGRRLVGAADWAEVKATIDHEIEYRKSMTARDTAGIGPRAR
jgi:protein-disulfide isomerase